MIRLHYSNRLDALIAPLAQAVIEAQRADALTPIDIVVPNRAAEQFVKFEIAERLGIAANLRFPFLRAFLARIVEQADSRVRVLEADALQVVIFEALRRATDRDQSDLAPALDYVNRGARTAGHESRALQLSARIAALFREYSISRRPMIDAWQRDRAYAAGTFAGAERWQRALWRMIFDERRCVRAEFLNDRAHRWMLLPDAIAALDETLLGRALAGPLHVFGLAYVGAAFAEIFNRLARTVEVRIYAINPCMEFWEDLDTSRRIDRARWPRRGEKLGSALLASDDPFDLLNDDDTRALQYWGRPGREYIRLLNELTDCEFEPHFVEAGSERNPTLLQRIQDDILFRNPTREPVDDGHGAPDDRSIRFLACPSIRREVEIVANAIWSMIRSANAEHRPLRFHEIAITMPNAVSNAYLPHVEAIFARMHDLPIDIAARGNADSRVAKAFDLLLDLPLGRFTRDQMLRLLTHPAIVGADGELETGRWSEWARMLGVYLGADDDDLGNTYIRGLYHWDQALKRLALGVFIEGAQGDEARMFEAADGEAYLPLELAEDDLDGAARMLRLARGMIDDARRMQAARLTVEEWSRLLIELLSTYIPAGADDDERVRERLLEAIESLAQQDFSTDQIGYQAMRGLVRARIGELDAMHGRLSRRGIAILPMSAIQSISFKVIFAIGLGEGIFPEHEPDNGLDLRGARRVAGDVAPADRDRYGFLQLLLAARDQLVLSYVARDGQTGDPLEPSSVIRELQSVLRGYVDDKTLNDLTIHHRVSRYDLAYFPALTNRPESQMSRESESFDPDARRGARIAALRSDLETHSRGAPLPSRSEELIGALDPQIQEIMRRQLRVVELPEVKGSSIREDREIRVTVSALRHYLECPLQGAARYALGMQSEEYEEPAEDEPLELTRLDHTILLRDVFKKGCADAAKMRAEYERAFRVAQMTGRAPAGSFGDAAALRDEARLQHWCDLLAASNVDSIDGWQEIRLGPADEFSTASTILPPLSLEVPFRNRDGGENARSVILHGSLGIFSPERDRAFNGVVRKESKPRDFVAMFLGAIVLAAAAQPMPRAFDAIVLPGPPADQPSIKRFVPPSAAEARAFLAALISDLLTSDNFYFFPIEAAAAAFKEMTKPRAERDIQQALDYLREQKLPTCASDYGPVRNARRFDPPSDERIAELWKRRYQPIASIFDNGKKTKRRA
jgi:exodeoxyribonuclease V gamma subunit